MRPRTTTLVQVYAEVVVLTAWDQLIHEAQDHLPGLVILGHQADAVNDVMAAWDQLIHEAQDHLPGLVILGHQADAVNDVMAAWDQLIHQAQDHLSSLVILGHLADAAMMSWQHVTSSSMRPRTTTLVQVYAAVVVFPA